MNQAVRKITATLPREVLDRAMRVTGTGITQTLIEALNELERSSKRSALRELRGKVRFDLDLGKTRR